MTSASGRRLPGILLGVLIAAPAVGAAQETVSPAHRLSKAVVIDPVYSAETVKPEPDTRVGGAPWLYGYGELETWQHRRLRQRVDVALLNVNYPGVFHEPFAKASFRLALAAGQSWPRELSFRAVGAVAVRVGHRTLYEAEARETPHRVSLASASSRGGALRVDLDAGEEVPALLVEDGPLGTAAAAWEWSADGEAWERPAAVSATRSGGPPHRAEVPEVVLEPVGSGEGGVLDFGRELVGRVSFRAAGTPSIGVGESISEALSSDPAGYEQDLALERGADGRWVSRHRLALRYLRIDGAEVGDVRIHAAFHPLRYTGAFASSDETLNRIWMTSAYTLRLNFYEFIIDGVKRDRLPWTGDLAMSLLAGAYTFAEPGIVRRTLIALGRAGIEESHINGIVDYSLWWVIAQDLFQLYYADVDFLERQWPLVVGVLEHFEAGADADGLLQPRPDDWVFIDWVDQEKWSALQVLWWWAQESGARLARRVGDGDRAGHWQRRADDLAVALRARVWSDAGWRAKPGDATLSRHANVLAVVSGLHPAEDDAAVRDALAGTDAAPVGTPYMAGFEMVAASRLGAVEEPIARLRRYWGGMLDQGATTFWEAYDPAQTGDAALAFYGRPFGKSLCHAWGAGPAAILPAEILGLRPTRDGWAEFTLEPRLGALSWVAATVPTPTGQIEVEVRGGQLTVRVPAGSQLVWRGESHRGPTTLRRAWPPAP